MKDEGGVPPVTSFSSPPPSSFILPMNRVLGIDLGDVRIGIAVSDELGMLAHPRETVDARKAKTVDRVAEIARREKVRVVILGLPRNMDGTEGAASAKARTFADGLRAKLGPDVEVRLLDERLTTVAAQKALHATGRDVRKSRPVVDQVAAQMILQTYLDSEAMRRDALLPPGFAENEDGLEHG